MRLLKKVNHLLQSPISMNINLEIQVSTVISRSYSSYEYYRYQTIINGFPVAEDLEVK